MRSRLRLVQRQVDTLCWVSLSRGPLPLILRLVLRAQTPCIGVGEHVRMLTSTCIDCAFWIIAQAPVVSPT